MFCRQCGRENADDVRFCPQCGTDQTTPGAAAAAGPPPAAAPVAAPLAVEPKRSNIGLIVAISVLLFVILALAAYLVAINMRKPDGANATLTNAALPTGSATAGAAAIGTALAPGAPTAGQMAGGEVLKFVTAAANIRNIATAQGATVVGTLRRGEQVKGTMYQGLVPGTYWFKLTDGRGYVSAVNLGDADPGPLPPPTAATRVPVAGASFCQVATSSGNLRIRSSPSGAIIGGMPAGARFQAYDGEHEADGSLWLRIQPVETRYPTGWVSGDYVLC